MLRRHEVRAAAPRASSASYRPGRASEVTPLVHAFRLLLGRAALAPCSTAHRVVAGSERGGGQAELGLSFAVGGIHLVTADLDPWPPCHGHIGITSMGCAPLAI
ncbi:unnamed protein product [Urochloa humidicola]